MKQPVLAAAVIVVLGLGSGPATPTTSQVSTPFVVAVSEGAWLFPVARYDGQGWLNTWPEPEEDGVPVPRLAEIPRAWLGGPVPTAWTLWFSTGGSVGVRVVGVERSGGCFASPKLTLEAVPPAPADLYDVMHAGLATTAGVPVEAVRRLSRGDREWIQLRSQIEQVFSSNERSAVNNYYPGSDGQMRERLSAERMAGIPITIEWLYRTTAGGAPTYYFEAAKLALVDERPVKIGVSGWLVPEVGGQLAPIRMRGQLSWIEELPKNEISDVSAEIPLGILRVNGRMVWVVEAPTGETGSFDVYDVSVTGARLLVSADAGGC